MYKMKKLIMLLLALFSTISVCLGRSSPDQVRDIDGNLVLSGTKYYILPAYRGMGGGLTLAPTRNKSCPLDVVPERQEVDRGLPLTFTPVDPKKGVIRESTDLNIIFSANSSLCGGRSNVWMIEEYEGQYIVSAHGVSGNPGRETVSNWFMIQKYEDAYGIAFCPRVCDSCKPVCGFIAVRIAENGIIRLALDDVPFNVFFKVFFKKA